MSEPPVQLVSFLGAWALGRYSMQGYLHTPLEYTGVPQPQVTNCADFVQPMCTRMQWMGRFVARMARSLLGWQLPSSPTALLAPRQSHPRLACRGRAGRVDSGLLPAAP